MAGEPFNFDAPLTLPAQIEARAQHPEVADRIFLLQEDRSWSYREFRDQSVRNAIFLLGRLGGAHRNRSGHVAMLLENHLELVSLMGGCAYAGLTLFGVNTGLRGELLAGVLNQSRARVLVVDQKFLGEVERIQGDLQHLAERDILVLGAKPGSMTADRELRACIEAEVGGTEHSLAAPSVDVEPDANLMVIYTSGTTGLPKGINNSHFKLCATGMMLSRLIELGRDDVGYACMPLFHSNSIFVGMMPAFWVGGAVAIRQRFSARGFLDDLLRYGVTYWNYVGEPVRYVLEAISNRFDGDGERILNEVANHSQNRLRYALGNGASPPDIDRFIRWLGLEDMFEFYGSTEATISTFRRKGDPRGSVGEVADDAVRILDENGRECPDAKLGSDGSIENYDEAVGEICRVSDDVGLFQGYFDNPEATSEKHRDGVYHSGDLGHVLIRDKRRYLFFDGRTDDWIRKDGENFSAAQVGRLISEFPGFSLAVAYGVPCAVSDELVMAAVKLCDGEEFEPTDFFGWCKQQVDGGSMDPKWLPDYVRVVDDFEYTQTQKILVRNLKQVHFDRRRLPREPIYWRSRGDTSFRPLTSEDYEGLRNEFAAAEKLPLLDR